jgi:hypothetical protein
MNKKIFRSVVLSITIVLILIVYLSTIGIKTEKFNTQILNQIKKVNNGLEVELKKIKITLDPFKLKIKIKTLGTNIKYRNKVIKLENVKSTISIKSLISDNFSVKNLDISTKPIEIKNLILFVRLFKNDAKFYIAEKFIKSGYVIADINLVFDKKGNIQKDYKIRGFVKNGSVNLFNRYNLSKIDFNFNINKGKLRFNEINLLLNENKIFIPSLISQRVKDKFLISGKIKNKKIALDKKDINALIDQNYFDIQKIEFSSENLFNFEINKKLKVRNIKIESQVDLKNLEVSNKFDLEDIFPKINKEVKFLNHKIKISYEKDNLDIKGSGNLLLQKNDDKIEYEIVKIKDNFNFETKFKILNNTLKLDFLNYQSKKNKDIDLYLKGKKTFNENLILEKISLNEGDNIIDLLNLFITDNNKIYKFDKLNLNYLDKQNIKNDLQILRKNKDYILKGKSFNLNKIIEDSLKSVNRNKKDLFFDNFKLKVNIKKVYLDKQNTVFDLDGHLIFKNNNIIDANLLSKFSNQEKIKFTVKSTKNEKITTLFSAYAKPLVKRYKFIKGFEEGVLDFYSIKKKDVTNSVLIIDNFKIQEVPVLAKLLTLASLQGIADLLTGEGIRFTDFEMKFSNKDQLMTIEEIYAIGPAISILMNGYIEKNKLISLRGTLVPATTINRTISSIPIIGNILVGKKVGEGVFGVSFKIKGPPKNLETSVNPIKTLTPRFITRTLEKLKN